MGIGSVSDYTSLLQNYTVPVIPGIGSEKVQASFFVPQENAVPDAAAARESLPAVMSEQNDTLRRDTALENVFIAFNRQEGFGYIGRDSDIYSLDVEKAIDDMKKDQVLHQYQYFVGSSRNLYGVEDIDGTVVQKL